MLRMRLQRGGTKKRPYYRIVVADIQAPRDGRFVEQLGIYSPFLEGEERVRFDTERVSYWLGVGVKPSERVYKFLAKADILPSRPIPTQTKKSLPSAKTLERRAAREEKKVPPATS